MRTRYIKLIAALLVISLFFVMTGCSEEKKASKERLEEFEGAVSFDEAFLQEKSYYADEDYVIAYDSAGVDQVFRNSREDVTYDDIRDSIRKLDTTDQYKEIYLTLADNLEQQHPDIDLRTWYHNLQTLKIEEVSDEELLSEYGVKYAAYSRSKNIIYTQDDYTYEPGTLEYQIIVHEFTHPIRTATFVDDDVTYYIRFESDPENYYIINEAMTSILAYRSYNKTDRDIAYRYCTHMIEIMLECMDNYTIEDYVNDDITYFIAKLNEANGDEQAIRILNLFQLQRDDSQSEVINYPPEQYYELYDYTARMYYRKHLKSGMSPDEIAAVRDELIERIEAYMTDADLEIFEPAIPHFDEYLKQYCGENGIDYQ